MNVLNLYCPKNKKTILSFIIFYYFLFILFIFFRGKHYNFFVFNYLINFMYLLHIMKIIFQPIFYFNEAAINFFMKDITNLQYIEDGIIEGLRQQFTSIAVRHINYFLMESDNIENDYEKLKSLQSTDIDIDTLFEGRMQSLKTTLYFNIFDKIQEGLSTIGGDPIDSIDDISDDMLKNEDFRQQLIDTGVDLSQLNYQTINGAQFAELINVIFLKNAFLLGANCRSSAFDPVVFESANLICANFSDSVINSSEFVDSDLRYSDFSNIINNYEVNFDNSDLRYAKIEGTSIFSMQCNNVNLQNSNCKNSNFRNSYIYNTNLQNSDCNGTIFVKCDLRNTNFTGSDLTNADFRMAKLNGTIFTGCILTNTKFHMSNWENSIYDNAAMETADRNTPYEVDEEIETIDLVEPISFLPPLPLINPYHFINNSNFTYNDVIQLLNPTINNVILQVSKMKINKYYRVSELGDTSIEMWTQIGVKLKPNNKIEIEIPFKCLKVPDEQICEGFVYESSPDCNAVHDLARQLNKDKIMNTFSLIIGNDELIKVFKSNYSLSNNELVKHFINILFLTITKLLKLHNEQDGLEGWTSAFDNTSQRDKIIIHALYHNIEGLINHPFFDTTLDGNPYNLLYLIMFLNTLPLQMRVYWAQNYIYQFITGYGQTLQTFDPTKKMPPFNFIASCINGNLEKLIITIRDAITHFIDGSLIKETEEEKQEQLLKVFTKNVENGFEKYYATSEDPSIEGYEEYLTKKEITADFTEDIKNKYIEILKNNQVIRSKLACIIHRIIGGGSKRKTKQKKIIYKNHHTFKKK